MLVAAKPALGDVAVTGIHATKWLRMPLVSGRAAFLVALGAVALPTLIRAAIIGAVTGCEFTPYLPFVLGSAILLRWWQASAVALASVAVMAGLFNGSLMHPAACFVPAASMFLFSSAVMIGFAVMVRRLITALQDRGADESAGGVVFSLEGGHVWASWYGQGAPVRLGSRSKVSRMMEDFLAQEELGERLNRRHGRSF